MTPPAPRLAFHVLPAAVERLRTLEDAQRRRALRHLARIAEDGGTWPLAQVWNERAPGVTSYSLVLERQLYFYEVNAAEGQLLLVDLGPA